MKYLLTFFLSLFCSAGCITAQPVYQQPANYQQKGAPIPPFRIHKVEGSTFTNQDLVKGKPVMILIFSPQCDHCTHVIDSLKNVADQFKTTQLIAVAEERHKEYMQPFLAQTKMNAFPLFRQTGTNQGELIAAVYTNKILPQVIVYDEQHRLVRILDGNFPFDSLKMYIK